MIKNYEKAKEIVKKYHQEHLLNFYEDLNDEEKNLLCNQICSIDFDQIFSLYKNSMINETIPVTAIDPLDYYIKANISNEDNTFFSKIGQDCIKNNEYAVVTMAGGQRY